MKKQPQILITNDDGIYAHGIYALWEAMQTVGKVTVVAPDTEKSAVGHAITISNPIRLQPVQRRDGFQGFAVDGTPADCVKIAVHALLESPPDLVVSGINLGANVGTNVIYSGTVSAATEGTLLGIPSMAISLDSMKDGEYTATKEVAINVAKKILQNGLPPGTLLNVNVPNLPPAALRGYRVTEQGNVYFKDRFDKREDPRGRIYYWMTGELVDPERHLERDSHALARGFISITPIHYQLTNQSFLSTLKAWDWT
ncbi:MAG: 5'/3'-nucleotidase SurE [Fidelibacterota bacterium]